MFDLDVQPQDSCRARSFWGPKLWEIGDPRNRNSAVSRHNVYLDRETTSLGVQKRMTVRLERHVRENLCWWSASKCGKERDMTRG